MAAHSASRPSSRGPASCGVGPVIARMVARVATAAQARAGRGTGDLNGDPTGDFPDASQRLAGRRWWVPIHGLPAPTYRAGLVRARAGSGRGRWSGSPTGGRL